MNLREITFNENEQKQSEGTYVAVTFSKETRNKLRALTKFLKLSLVVPREKMHATVIYSKEQFDYKALGEINPPWIAKATGFEIWKRRGENSNALVLTLECDELIKQHESIMAKYPATYDFPHYQPHTTLSYNVGDMEKPDFESIKEMIPSIEIIEEYTRNLVLDWSGEDDS